jgi:chromosome segregation ATPase
MTTDILPHKPNHLGQEVADANPGNQRMPSEVADQLGVINAATEELPPVLREARKRLEEAARLKQEAEQGITEGVRAWRAYHSALDLLAELRKDLAIGLQAVEELRGMVANLPAEFEAQCFVKLRACRFPVLLAQIAAAQQAREALKFFPEAIKNLRARIAKAEAEIAEMEKVNGFGQEVPPAPLGNPSAELEPAAPYEKPAAFRGQE